MNKILYAIASVLAFASCANSYNIEGSANLPSYDGQKLYLKVFDVDDMKSVDSCDVVHGKFTFSGTVDSAQWANIYITPEFFVPVVLESGNIIVSIDNMMQAAISGTPQNDELNTFLKTYRQINSEVNDLQRASTQMILNGMSEEQAAARYYEQLGLLDKKIDKQVMSFITTNFNNAVGPCSFFLLTQNNQYPIMEVWMEDLLSKATPTFKNDGYVHFYCSEAKKFQEVLNGMRVLDDEPQGTADLPATPPMTPKQMAGDSVK